MHQRAGTRPSGISPLQLFALVTIAGAILLHTALFIGFLTNTPRSDKSATIAAEKYAVRVVAHAEM
jgi:hypothetical protein